LQVTGGAPAKVAKIGVIRKNIARVLTVFNQLSKSKVKTYLFDILLIIACVI
jgi:ribosomal protein L29